MRFSDIVGHDNLKKQLIRSVQTGHIAHAQLYLGPEGNPGLAMALAFSTYVFCRNRSETDSCGECDGCRKCDKLVHPDLHFSFPVSPTAKVQPKDAVSASFITEWRNFIIQDPYNNAGGWNGYFGGENKQLNISKEESRHIIRNLSLKSFEGTYKIMIIWLPEYMHPATANAMLKILEEPSPETVFILVSNDERKLLPTIISRTQLVKIMAFTDVEIKHMLMHNHFIDEDKANQIAHLTDGNINEALRLAREVEDNSHIMFRDWMRLCYVGKIDELVAWTEKFNKMSRVEQQTLFQYGLSIMREALIVSCGEMSLSRLMGEELNFIENFSKVLDPDAIEAVSEVLNTSYYHIERNAHAKILFMDTSLRIFEIFAKMKLTTNT